MRKASHRGSKQQKRSCAAVSLTIACSCYIYNGVILHAHPVRGESHNQCNATGEVATVPTSVATSDVLTSDLMFSEKFLMSDVLATNLMLTGLLFLFPTFPILLG